VIVNGLGFEGWIDRLIKSSGYRGKLVVASQGVNAMRQPRAHAGKHGRTITPAMSTRMPGRIWPTPAATWPTSPQHSATPTRPNRSIRPTPPAWTRRSARSTAKSAAPSAPLPADAAQGRHSHDAFAYFGRAYGIRFIAPVGVSTDAEPSAGEVGAIIRQIRQREDQGDVHREHRRPAPARTHQP
jgi:zinc/manganese transport system substrate-binding protein